jgi:TonB family protein
MNLLLTYALNVLWQVPLIAGAGWLLSRLCRAVHPRVLHGIRVATLLLAVVMPAAAISGGPIASSRVGTAGVRLLAAGPDAPLPRHLFQHGVLSLSHPWMDALAGLYLALVLFAILRLLVGVLQTLKLSRASEPVTMSPAQTRIWQRCRAIFSITDAELGTSPAISGPAVIGCHRPVLLLPSHFLEETTDEELLAALAHESAHIARHDYLLNLLYECLALPIAWHPVTVMLKARIAQMREVACDQMVAESVMQSTLYAGALLRLASRVRAPFEGPNIHAVGIFDANILEERVMHLRNKGVALGWGKKAAITVAAIAIAGGCAVSAVALSVHVDQADTAAAAKTVTGQVYKVGGDVSAPTLIYSVDPSYSEQARRAKYQGVCLVQVVVNAQGSVQRTKVLRPLGMGLDKKAVQAVKQYRFTPALRNGKPVQVALNVEVNFRIY